MEIIFSQLKQKDVICISDGKHLGKVNDLVFNTQNYCVPALCVTGSKGFKFTKQDQLIPVEDIVKIGEDAILVKFSKKERNDGNDCCEGNSTPNPSKCQQEKPCTCPPESCSQKKEKPSKCQQEKPCACPPESCPSNGCSDNGKWRRNLDEYE